MMKTRRIKKNVLLFSSAVLVLMTVLILVVLYDRQEDAPPPDPDRPNVREPRQPVPAATTPRRTPAIRRNPAHASEPGTASRPPRSTRAPDAGTRSTPGVVSARRDPHVAHTAAPATEPAAIAAERDPVRRQALRRMHQLATSEVRVRLLGRRSRMLRGSLARARKDGTWSAEKIRREEASLKQIEDTVAATRTEVERLKKQLSIRQ